MMSGAWPRDGAHDATPPLSRSRHNLTFHWTNIEAILDPSANYAKNAIKLQIIHGKKTDRPDYDKLMPPKTVVIMELP